MEANIFTTQFDEDFKGIFKQAALGPRVNAERLGISLYELAPECPRELSGYHMHYGNEELLIVLAGRPTVRTPEDELAAWFRLEDQVGSWDERQRRQPDD